jgi:hypothetical protein
MPVINGVGAFNTGIDCQVVLVGPFGQITIPNVTSFHVQQKVQAVTSDLLNGVQLNAELPKGWTWTLDCDRNGSQLDDLFASIEANWYNGGTISFATLYQYINETNGSQSTYQQDSCSLKYDDPGTWKGDSITKQRISGTCNRRIKV